MIDQNRRENPDYPFARGLPLVMVNPNPTFNVGDWVIANEWIAKTYYMREKTRVIQTRLIKVQRNQPPTEQIIVSRRDGQWFAASHFKLAESPVTKVPQPSYGVFPSKVESPLLVTAVSTATFNAVQDVKAAIWERDKTHRFSAGEITSVVVWADRAVRLGLLNAARYFAQFGYIDPAQIGKDLMKMPCNIALVSEESALRRMNTTCHNYRFVSTYGTKEEEKFAFDLYEVMRVQYMTIKNPVKLEDKSSVVPEAILSKPDTLAIAKTRLDAAEKNLITMEHIHAAVFEQYPETEKMNYAGKRSRDMASANLGAARSEFLFLKSVYTRLSVS